MSERFNRGVAASTVAAMPAQFDILQGSADPHVGEWIAIKVYNADFPNNSTDVILGSGTSAEGKNLFVLNSLVSQGERINGNFTSITIAAESTMVLLAYRW